MVSSSLCLLNSPVCPHSLPNVSSQPLLSFSRSLRPFVSKSKPLASQEKKRDNSGLVLVVKSQALDFSGTFFEGGFGSDDDPTSPSVSTALEDKPEPQCPPGLRQYETMAVLRPDMSEDERLGLTQKYEEVNQTKKMLEFMSDISGML
ncbi:hypothetical protein DY000_02012415 [Brassica cretica]|uniref:Uncharacterized protein n=1 Tax=Brassica cretica TaxID=69181 RepID=A0ABQ7CRD2_BRACR|nr:hypothetical protein DY000_02012415 [Brassica cretica]